MSVLELRIDPTDVSTSMALESGRRFGVAITRWTSIGCLSRRIAIVPIFNSMLISQQRSDGSLVRLFDASTTMRCRLIEKSHYRVVPVRQLEFILFEGSPEIRSRSFMANIVVPFSSINSKILSQTN